MIIDGTGIILTPSDYGEKCLGNGSCKDKTGKEIECCCDECAYYICCFGFNGVPTTDCDNCYDFDCPRSVKNK